MRLPNMVSILLFTFALLLLIPNIAAAALIQESAEIPYQISNSDRIVIGTVSEIHTYDTYSVNTITVKEWLYNPLPAKTINVTNKIGTNLWVEDEAEFTLHESVLLMLKDSDLNKLLFTVSVGFPGKHPISDRDAVIEELKAQDKWQGEDQIGNKTNETETVNNSEHNDDKLLPLPAYGPEFFDEIKKNPQFITSRGSFPEATTNDDDIVVSRQ